MGMDSADSFPVFTIGHSTRPLPAFMALLEEQKIGCLIDVRRLPGSRAFPQYDSARLHQSLHDMGVAYVWAQTLGGRRARSLPADDPRNAWWQNASFRHYADYALGPAFAAAIARLERRVYKTRCAVMCAEAVWWRCHRRIIADHLLARGHQVLHIMGPGKVPAAAMSAGARYRDGVVTYPDTGSTAE